MPYMGSASSHYAGDPFIGPLLGAAGGLVSRLLGRKTVQAVAGKVGGGLRLPGGVAPTIRRVAPVAGSVGIAAGAARMSAPGAAAAGELPPAGYTRAKVWVPGQGYRRVGHVVKVRRRNVTNPKALRRALSRVEGFGRLAARAKKDVRRAASAIGANPRRSSARQASNAPVRGEIVRVG